MRVWLQLSRWQEFVPFALPLTVLGALLGAEFTARPLDGRLLASLAGNMLAVAYAFMLNDIEDAPDDALDAARAPQNVIASGRLSARAAYRGCALAAAAALACYALGGWWVLITGAVHAGAGASLFLAAGAPEEMGARRCRFARADAERAALPDGLLALRARAGGSGLVAGGSSAALRLWAAV